MGQKFRNNFTSTLSESITAISTEISLLTAPSPVITFSETDDFFLLTLIDESGNCEIVKCVGISGLTMIIGIDLGTTNSEVAVMEAGKPTIIKSGCFFYNVWFICYKHNITRIC